MAKAALNGCFYTWTSKLTVYAIIFISLIISAISYLLMSGLVQLFIGSIDDIRAGRI